MARWKIEGCTVDDAAAVARNTGGAFWEEPMWKLQWTSDITQEFITEQLVKLQPLRLLRDRDALRHQKAVDPDTGELVGYARWRLPEERTTATGGELEWAEAQIPDVSAEKRKTLEDGEAGAWWDPRTDVDELDDDNAAAGERATGGRPHISGHSFLGGTGLLLTACAELEFLGVHPRNKGKGIATSLVKEGIRQAQRMQLPILTVAYKAARGVYARAGFVEVERITKDDTRYGGNGEYTWYFMIYNVPKKD